MGYTRLIYNRALAIRTEAWYSKKKRVGYSDTSAMLTEWKKQEDLQFLNDVSCVPLQQGLRHLQKAFSNFFEGRTKYPTFKKKRNGGSAEFTKSAFKWRNGQVYLAKCTEPLLIRWSRELPQGAEPSNITVKLSPAGRWSVSLLVDLEIEPLPESSHSVGIDLGVTSLVTLSTGVHIANPKGFNTKRRQLKKVQKALSRKQKGSNNRQKAQLKVAKVYQEISNARLDFLHKLTTQLVRENQTIAIEDLAVKNLVQNRKLALSISDASWGASFVEEASPTNVACELIRQLEYKCDWYGRTLVKIDRWFPSSKRCGECGHIVEKLPLNIRQWTCPQCGAAHDRDINAANNILAVGLAVKVCGANVRPDRHKSNGSCDEAERSRK